MQKLCKYCKIEIEFEEGSAYSWTSLKSQQGFFYICPQTRNTSYGHEPMSNLDYLEWKLDQKESQRA